MRLATHCRALATLGFSLYVAAVGTAAAQTALPTPTFHHLHLNSTNPDAAIDFYTRLFPSTAKTTFAGQPALHSAIDVLVLFTKVESPPATQPATAFWHFGWHVKDVHKSIDTFRRLGVTLLPLYVEESGGTVATNADTWPSVGRGLGMTKADIAEAKAKGTKPTYGAGFAYFRGPDDAIVEYQGNMAVERFNHVHLWMEQPFCTQLWYQKHLNVSAAARSGDRQTSARTEANCRVDRGKDKTWPALEQAGMHRSPVMNAIAFGDVSLYGYMNQTDTPLVSTRGHLVDHFALQVRDLDAWVGKLRGENVRFLEDGYRIGDYRAVMIEGPNREAIELVEIKE